MSWDTSASISSRTTNATASRNRSPCSPAIALATTSAAVIIWPSAIVVLLLIELLAKPTRPDATVVGTLPRARPGARYTTSTDMTAARDLGPVASFEQLLGTAGGLA